MTWMIGQRFIWIHTMQKLKILVCFKNKMKQQKIRQREGTSKKLATVIYNTVYSISIDILQINDEFIYCQNINCQRENYLQISHVERPRESQPFMHSFTSIGKIRNQVNITRITISCNFHSTVDSLKRTFLKVVIRLTHFIKGF